MSVNAIANRYAESLYSVLSSEDSEKAVLGLEAIRDLFKLEDASKILLSPVMPSELKSDLFRYALEKASGPDALMNFCEVVISSDRVSLIPDIYTSFVQIVQEAKGVKVAELVSASPLGDDELEKIRQLAEKKFESKLEIDTKIDEEILGGFLINVGNKRIDLSLKSRLEALTATAAQ
jgi:F-type H+-transporting ATPase subunit delta